MLVAFEIVAGPGRALFYIAQEDVYEMILYHDLSYSQPHLLTMTALFHRSGEPMSFVTLNVRI